MDIDNPTNISSRQTPFQVQGVTKFCKTKMFLITSMLLVLVSVISYYLGAQTKKEEPDTTSKIELNNIKEAVETPIEEIPKQVKSEEKKELEVIKEDITKIKGWTNETIEELGITFKLPKYFGQMDYPNGYEIKGETGKQICIQYLRSDIVSFLIKKALAGGSACFPKYFGLGTTSTDYQAGRGTGFGDFRGYSLENGKYDTKPKAELPMEFTKEVINSNGVEILLVVGASHSSQVEGDNLGLPVLGTPGAGRIGAIVNLPNNNRYTGVTFEMNLDEKLTPDLFNLILSTIKVTQ